MSVTDNILEFWLHDVGPKGWYAVDQDVDAEIAARYAGEWEAARRGERDVWCNGPRGTLAYLILTDQFPRNMFRGDPRAFATDDRARHAAGIAIEKGWDLKIAEPERQFPSCIPKTRPIRTAAAPFSPSACRKPERTTFFMPMPTGR